jgi:hypothetical protein
MQWGKRPAQDTPTGNIPSAAAPPTASGKVNMSRVGATGIQTVLYRKDTASRHGPLNLLHTSNISCLPCYIPTNLEHMAQHCRFPRVIRRVTPNNLGRGLLRNITMFVAVVITATKTSIAR